jgi:hypothetical protein
LIDFSRATYDEFRSIQTVSIDEAKDHFFDLIATTAEGGEVIMAKLWLV